MHDWYIFGACFMHSLMVQVGAWLMHFFMVHVVWYRWLHVVLVQVYSSISHSDGVTVVTSFYLYFRAVGRGKARWL
jgi:hypothetical protein